LSELAFRDGIMDQIRLREPRFHERAFLFVLSALEFCQGRLPERRHITGAELARACRDLALDRYGVMARLVLEHWGIRQTTDIGDIVFALVDLGLRRRPAVDPPGTIRIPTDAHPTADVPQVRGRHAPPAERLRTRRRPDHLQGVGVQQPGVRVQPPHRQRGDRLRAQRRAVAQVTARTPRLTHATAASPAAVSVLEPPTGLHGAGRV
jgi:uncharacterized repeat protein (TIGR04138 family)